MAKNKTTETSGSVIDFINSVADERKRHDSQELIKIFEETSGFKPKMWGSAIIGFGSYHYKYASGHEGDAPLVAFSPRANAISLYVMHVSERRQELLTTFGKYKGAVGCIYIKKLSDVDTAVLKKMITESISDLKARY